MTGDNSRTGTQPVPAPDAPVESCHSVNPAAGATELPAHGHHGHHTPTRFELHEGMSTQDLVCNILINSMPLGLAAVAQFSMGAVLVAMVGRLFGPAELGATSLAFGLINATAFAIAAGFCGALETVLSQSYGRDPRSKIYGVYAQRMTIMLFMISVLIAPLLLFSEQLLVAIGQNPTVAHFTGRFCRVAVIGLFPAMMLELLRRYFACQNLNNPLSVNLVSGAVLFPFFLYPLLRMFGYTGAPIAWCFLMSGMSGSLVLYLWYTGKYKRTWGGWDKSAVRNWKPLLKLALPSMLVMLSEWAALEVNAVVAGFAPEEGLAAFSILYQLSALLWGIVSGVFIYVAVLVGSAIGQHRNAFARRCAATCLAVSCCLACVNIVVLLLFRNYIPRIFTSDDSTVEVFKTFLIVYIFYHFADCVQSCMMGILRGCGRQNIGAVTVAIVYSVVGVPSGIIMFFRTDIGVKALWIGPTIGVTVVGMPMYMYMFFRYIKWDDLKPEHSDEAVHVVDISEDERMSVHTVAITDSRHVSENDDDDDFDARHPSRRASASDADELDDALSVRSNFHIPQRNILLTQYVVPSSPVDPDHAHGGLPARADPLADDRCAVSSPEHSSRPPSPKPAH